MVCACYCTNHISNKSKPKTLFKYLFLDKITHDDIIFSEVTCELTSALTTDKIYNGNSNGKLLVNTTAVCL